MFISVYTYSNKNNNNKNKKKNNNNKAVINFDWNIKIKISRKRAIRSSGGDKRNGEKREIHASSYQSLFEWRRDPENKIKLQI